MLYKINVKYYYYYYYYYHYYHYHYMLSLISSDNIVSLLRVTQVMAESDLVTMNYYVNYLYLIFLINDFL